MEADFRDRTGEDPITAGVVLHVEPLCRADGYRLVRRATDWDGSAYLVMEARLLKWAADRGLAGRNAVARMWARRWVRRGTLAIAACVVAALLAVAGSGLWLHLGARGHIYTEQTVPAAPVALVLGAKVDPDGAPSAFLAARLELARRLYEDGKVRAILVSGDHMHWDYDEPDTMREWLIARGVPARKVVADYAGFDTYDSCSRARRIFGVTRAIVVTQTYHIPRAVTLCRHLGVRADGVGDDSVRVYRRAWFASSTREYGAWLKAVVDVASGRDPRLLGRHETGIEDALRGD